MFHGILLFLFYINISNSLFLSKKYIYTDSLELHLYLGTHVQLIQHIYLTQWRVSRLEEKDTIIINKMR